MSSSEFPPHLVWIVYTLICLSVIGGVINLFQLIQFVNHQKERFLSSRRPNLIIVYCSISLSISILFTPILFYAEALAPAGETKEWMEFTIEFIAELLTIILLTIVLLRTWLLFFDYNFATAVIDQDWRGIINPNEHNFWLTSRKTYGTTRYMIMVCIFIDTVFVLGLIAIAIVIASTVETEHSGYSNALFHYFTIYGLGIPFAIIMLVILYKIGQNKSIEDTFFIQKEIKFLTAIILFRILGLLVNTAYHSENENVWHLWFFFIEVISRFLLVYTQSWWVLNKLKQQNKTEPLDGRIASVSMNDVFTYENGVGLLSFIRHCVNEMSVENILFLIEICQYKIAISQRVSVSDHSEYCMESFLNVFEAGFGNILPAEEQATYTAFRLFISQQEHSIPRPEHDDDDVFKYALYLYRKYVDEKADLVINVSAIVRSNLANVFRFESFHPEQFESLHSELFESFQSEQFESKDWEKFESFRKKCLYHVFDVAFREIWLLILNDTFFRFRRTKQCYALSAGSNQQSKDDLEARLEA
eukprot:591290_1